MKIDSNQKTGLDKLQEGFTNTILIKEKAEQSICHKMEQ